MAKQPQNEVIVVGFNYDAMETEVAEQVQSAAARIREKVKRTVEDIIEVGKDLLAVKEALPHGAFGRWLKAEFGWGERMAQNFMSVAERFGPKTEMIADLRIAPTAAYLLAAPSAPDEARQVAFERATAGERITAKEAKKILAATRRKGTRKSRRAPAGQLAPLLVKLLDRYRKRWNPKELTALSQQLRDYANALDEQKGGKKTKTKEQS